jgi:hypothetical protein
MASSVHKKKLHDLSPRANYTDRATAACWQSDCQHFADRGCHVVSLTDPYSRILGFLDRTAPFLSSSSSVVFTRLSGPRSRPTIFFSGSARNRIRICSQELWPLDDRGGPYRISGLNNNYSRSSCECFLVWNLTQFYAFYQSLQTDTADLP